MSDKLKEISINIPNQLLMKAREITKLNQTDTIIAGLRELIAQQERKVIVDLKGKINFKTNLDELRQRVRL